jgi:hypothetical protein
LKELFGGGRLSVELVNLDVVSVVVRDEELKEAVVISIKECD